MMLKTLLMMMKTLVMVFKPLQTMDKPLMDWRSINDLFCGHLCFYGHDTLGKGLETPQEVA